MFNVRHLQTFVTIADGGSFASAADRLGLTQSAVSMQVKALESDLQQVLFDRSRRSPQLNDLGESLLPPRSTTGSVIITISTSFSRCSLSASKTLGWS